MGGVISLAFIVVKFRNAIPKFLYSYSIGKYARTYLWQPVESNVRASSKP